MAAKKEQDAMDHFNDLARNDPEHQATHERIKKQIEDDKRRRNERLDGRVKLQKLFRDPKA